MTTTALQPASQTQAPTMYSQADYVRWQIVGKDIDKDEFDYFLAVANHLGLDPLRRQIYCVKRDGRAVVQTGIDGYRAIAARSGLLAGIDDAEYGPEDSKGYPLWARVTVYRLVKGQRYAFTATARWSEYVQKTKDGTVTRMWQRMPYLMLSKCAESRALRMAFPSELSGVYTEEEMMQADNPLPTVQVTEQRQETTEQKQQPATSDQRKQLPLLVTHCHQLRDHLELSTEEWHALLNEYLDKEGVPVWPEVRKALWRQWAAKYGYIGNAYTAQVEQATGKKIAVLLKSMTDTDAKKIEERLQLIENSAKREAAKGDGKPAIVVEADPAPAEAPDEEPEPVEEGYEAQAALADEASGLHIVR